MECQMGRFAFMGLFLWSHYASQSKINQVQINYLNYFYLRSHSLMGRWVWILFRDSVNLVNMPIYFLVMCCIDVDFNPEVALSALSYALHPNDSIEVHTQLLLGPIHILREINIDSPLSKCTFKFTS
jgi:hypothetical protein